jgi:hypothetical protein
MRAIYLVFFCAVTLVVHSQDLIVRESRRAFYSNGKVVNIKDSIPPGTKVRIEKKGKLFIDYKNRWTLYFKTGMHNIDSALRIELAKPEFKKHDSIYSILDHKGLQECRFKYKYTEVLDNGAVHGTSRVDDIKISGENVLTAKSGTVALRWTHPLDYSGNYYVLVTDLFSQYIGLVETKASEVNLDLSPYMTEKRILLKIIAEDCRESYEKTVETK